MFLGNNLEIILNCIYDRSLFKTFVINNKPCSHHFPICTQINLLLDAILTQSSDKIDSTKVEKLLKDLNIHKSTGPNGIGNLLLRNCSNSITKSVTFLYQTIMNKGTYTKYWKVSQISLIFKDGNKSDVICYRPISLLNCISKVLEKVTFDEIYKLVRHELCESLFGFRKNRSTTLQLLLFLDTVYKKFDNEAIKDLSILYLDFAKAFDMVPHNILIQNRYNIGVGGKFIQLIWSYLSNRTQYVKISNDVSDLIEVTSCVPQGSILGPLFFIIFINNLPEHLTELICFGLADDMKLINQKQCNTGTAISSLSTWCEENQMRLNYNKNSPPEHQRKYNGVY